jgi:hypothetical protein
MGWLFAASAVLFVGGLVAMPLLVARMRPDYFVRRRPGAESWGGRHPAVRFTLHAVKNLTGLVLLAAGIAMLVLPGQGIITIVAGLSLLDLPGKRRLELWIVRQRPVLHAINWIREKAHRPPLELPDDPAAD